MPIYRKIQGEVHYRQVLINMLEPDACTLLNEQLIYVQICQCLAFVLGG